MKNALRDITGKVLARKGAMIASVNDFLKNIYQVEQSRHRSQVNFLVNLLEVLSA
jgi:hypothetical protein